MSRLDITVGSFRIIHKDNEPMLLETTMSHLMEARCILVLAQEIQSLREQLEAATSRFDAETENGSSLRGPGQIA